MITQWHGGSQAGGLSPQEDDPWLLGAGVSKKLAVTAQEQKIATMPLSLPQICTFIPRFQSHMRQH